MRYNINNQGIVLSLIFLCIRTVLAALVELTPDEAYYWVCANNFALSYFDHPPFNVWTIKLFSTLLGDTELGVRMMTLISGFVISLLAYRTILTVGGKESTAILCVLVVNLMPIFTFGGMLATPDIVMVLAAALCVYFVVMLQRTENVKYLWIIAVMIGIGLLAKYTMSVYALALGLIFVAYKPFRKYVSLKNLGLMIFIVIAVFLPVIIWNLTNDFVSFKFQWSHGFSVKENTPLLHFMEYIGGQLAVVSPLLGIMILVAGVYGLVNGIVKQKFEYILFSVPFMVLVLFFGYSSTRAHVEANWPVSGYYTGVLLLMLVLDNSKINVLLKKIIVGISILVAVFVNVLIAVPDILYAFGINLTRDAFTEVYGWRSLANEIETRVKDDNTYILTPSYQIASELKFYYNQTNPELMHKVKVTSTGSRVSGYDYFKDNTLPKGSNVIGIEMPLHVATPVFNSCSEQVPLDIMRKQRVVRRVHLMFCKNYKGGLI